MVKFTVYIVHAFTADGRNGNPAGVVLDATGLSSQAMQAIAAQVGLAETAFVGEANNGVRHLRFFTPAVEEPLCGHATVASWFLLHKLGRVTVGVHQQHTKAGVLQVRIQDDGMVFMEQAPVELDSAVSPAQLAPLLGIQPSAFAARSQPRIVSTGVRDVMVPLALAAMLDHLHPDMTAIAAFSRQQRVSGLHVFALLDSDSVATARNFAPADGIPEECATGTANGALLCYLKSQKTLPQQARYRIDQGAAMGQLSHVFGTFVGERVWIGGTAKLKQSLELRT